MEPNIAQLIKARLAELPPEIGEAIADPSLVTKFTAIADRHSLNLDQNGSLQIKTLLVMLGLEPSDEYVNNIKNELGVSRPEAESIAEDVNKEILATIRNSIMKQEQMEEKAEDGIEKPRIQNVPTPPPAPPRPIPSTPIEKAAQINIIPQPVSHSPQYNHETLDREAVLNDLENIEKLQPKKANDFVEHLLSNPVSNPAQQIEVKKDGQVVEQKAPQPVAPVVPKKVVPPPPPRQGGIDPYREPF